MPDDTLLQRQQAAQRPGMAVLSTVGWIEVMLSLVMAFVDLTTPGRTLYIAIAFAAAACVLGTAANAIRSSGRWYDREAGMWRRSETPPARSAEGLSPVFIANIVISGALVAGAVLVLVLAGQAGYTILLSLYALAVTILLSRFR
ncbi:MAG: hypothetical protein ACFB51_04755 [Anaerolineae bacterium]